MNVKGYCFFSNIHNGHVIVIISDEDPEGKALCIPISSIKPNLNGSHIFNGQACCYYDSSCTFQAGDIKDDNGRDVLVKPSYALYQMAAEVDCIAERMKNEDLKYRCKVSKGILERLQDGAKTSDELAEHFKKYFIYF